MIKLPTKTIIHGRPKETGQTVIGFQQKPNDSLKRKSSQSTTNFPTKRKLSETATNSPAKRKFLDLSIADQSMKIVQWLTNKSQNEITRKKVTYSDIIQDSNIFNRLRNDGIHINCIKKLVDAKCFSYLKSEVDRLNSLMWGCTKCKRNLSGEKIMCNGCLDWYHLGCIKTRQGKVVTSYFCFDCEKSSN